MARKTRQPKAPANNPWLTDAEELPRADIELVGKSDKRVKVGRFVILSCLVLTPIMSLAWIVAIPKLLETPEPVKVADNLVTSETKPTAILAVESWLAQSPAPLPGGRLVSWDGVEIQATPSLTSDPNTNQTIETQGLELHNMTVASGTGSVFTTQVQVGYSPFRGAQLIGKPTLIPRAPDDKTSWPNLTAWPNLTKVTKTEEIDQAVSAWVNAFTSGNPNTLRLAIGDTGANRSYVPLNQATPSDIQVTDTASPAGDVKSSDSTQKRPSSVVARVSFAVRWQGQTVTTSDTLSRVSYDVLIEKADTAAPVVVAWGGAGSGETLKAYMNAVEGRKITQDGIGATTPSAAAAAPATTTDGK
jgi:hypothetical protein